MPLLSYSRDVESGNCLSSICWMSIGFSGYIIVLLEILKNVTDLLYLIILSNMSLIFYRNLLDKYYYIDCTNNEFQ